MRIYNKIPFGVRHLNFFVPFFKYGRAKKSWWGIKPVFLPQFPNTIFVSDNDHGMIGGKKSTMLNDYQYDPTRQFKAIY